MFNVHRSSYKYWVKKQNTVKPKLENEVTIVKSIFDESNGSAGARTIANIATNRGVPLSRYRAGRLMSQHQLESCQPPKHAYKRSEEHTSELT